jgi:ectoine hydroxylase
MKLTPSQLQQYDAQGYLVLPKLLSAAEIEALREGLAAAVHVQDDRILREKSSDAVRMVYDMHNPKGPVAHTAYERLVRLDRIAQPARDLLGAEVNVFHTKVNSKEAIHGEYWQWHQDFVMWGPVDKAPAPRLVTTLIMLDKATEVGGCLYFIPGSHKLGLVEAHFDERTSAKLDTVSKRAMIDVVARCGEPVAIAGEAGTVVMFHPYLIHGSGWNMSVHDRRQIYVVYNAVDNALGPTPTPRPEYKASRQAGPVTSLVDSVVAHEAVAA